MKFATIRSLQREELSRDGMFVLVDQTRQLVQTVGEMSSLVSVLESWESARPLLEQEFNEFLSDGDPKDAIPFSEVEFLAPIPRSYSFLDGSAFLSHVRRVRKARGAPLPPRLEQIPLMYQGVSAPLLSWNEDIPLGRDEYGLDFEAEFAVVLRDTPQGISAKEAGDYICLLVLLNDVSLRELIPDEVGTGFGFIKSKPPSSFAPFAIEPRDLGTGWKNGRVFLPVTVSRNSDQFGCVHGGEMHFSFGELIAHAAATRPLPAGSIIGSGTVSNDSLDSGFACIVEKRMQEIIDSGAASTPYLKPDETIAINCHQDGVSLFGEIKQKVTAPHELEFSLRRH